MLRDARAAFLERVFETIPVESYDTAVADKRGAHDFMISATAVATKRVILTTDRRARYGNPTSKACNCPDVIVPEDCTQQEAAADVEEQPVINATASTGKVTGRRGK